MKESNTKFDTQQLYIAVLHEEATVASLLDRVHSGETAELYYLKNNEDQIQGVVDVMDVLEFFAPYLLFVDADELEHAVVNLGEIPLKEFSKKIYPTVSMYQELPSIIQDIYAHRVYNASIMQDSKQMISELTCIQLLKKLPQYIRKDNYAV